MNKAHNLRIFAPILKPGVSHDPAEINQLKKISNYIIYGCWDQPTHPGCRFRTTPKLPESSPGATPLGTTMQKGHQVTSVSITLRVVFANRSQAHTAHITIYGQICISPFILNLQAQAQAK